MKTIWTVTGTSIFAAVLLFGQTTYNERFRPQFHFSPATNWTNDPCGLVYVAGKYHLFFQHNPFANIWGNMSWGHATSEDLVRWHQQPVAIPADPQVAIFTGSSVFDRHNSSGLCSSSEGCIVSIFTGFTPKTGSTPERQTQNLASSQDGVTWTKYRGNPVLDLGRSDTRDPKVFWHAPTRQWVMAIVRANEKKVQIFGSPNLREWHHLSDFGPQGGTGGVWECPDLYELPVPGKQGQTRWILKVGMNPGHIAGGSGEQYFIGEFDGRSFHNANPADQIRWLDYGKDCYCALTFNNQPHPESPRMIGWMNNWQYAGVLPTQPWRGAMTLPRTLRLVSDGDNNLKLAQEPVPELTELRTDSFSYDGTDVAQLNKNLAAWPSRSQSFELSADLRLGASKNVVWKLLAGSDGDVLLGYDGAKNELFVDRTNTPNSTFSKEFVQRTAAPLRLSDGSLRLHVFVDRSSVEVFAQDGAVALTNLALPGADDTGISLQSDGPVERVSVHVWKLRSAWTDAVPTPNGHQP